MFTLEVAKGTVGPSIIRRAHYDSTLTLFTIKIISPKFEILKYLRVMSSYNLKGTHFKTLSAIATTDEKVCVFDIIRQNV